MTERLTPKQRAFIEAYVGPARGNATQAARLAGYRGSDATLAEVGHENLRKPEIAAAVSERTEKALGGMGADEVIERVAKIARSEGERTSDCLRALELLGKYHALWSDVQEIRDLPKDERALDAMIEHHLKRVMGVERAEIVLKALREKPAIH